MSDRHIQIEEKLEMLANNFENLPTYRIGMKVCIEQCQEDIMEKRLPRPGCDNRQKIVSSRVDTRSGFLYHLPAEEGNGISANGEA